MTDNFLCFSRPITYEKADLKFEQSSAIVKMGGPCTGPWLPCTNYKIPVCYHCYRLSSKTYLSHNIFTVSFYFNEYYTYMLCEHCHMCVPMCGSVWRLGTNLGVPAQDVATLRVGLSLRPAAYCRGSGGWPAGPRDLPLFASSAWTPCLPLQAGARH